MGRISMKKVKKDLVSKKKPIEVKKVENTKAPKVADLAPKAKNLAKNLKEESEGMRKGKKKPGDITKVDINPRLQKSNKKK